MHGKLFLCDSVYAGIDETHVYARLDFAEGIPQTDFEIVVNLESRADQSQRARRALRLIVKIENRAIRSWEVYDSDSEPPAVAGEQPQDVAVALDRSFEFKLPLGLLLAAPITSPSASGGNRSVLAANRLRVRISLWQNRLPVDALPVEGWIELQLLSEDDLMAIGH
jgi:hypothetical protein